MATKATSNSARTTPRVTPAKRTPVPRKRAATQKAVAQPEPLPVESTDQVSGKPEGLELARLCARYADDKKAENIVILDVRNLSPITDYLVICSANSTPHLRTVRDEVADKLKQDHGVSPVVSDGAQDSQWLVVGYSDVVVHVLSREKREFYALEELWNDAPQVPLVG